jgi:N-methylhydantoinase A
MGITIGIDIGGTFTDVVALDADGNVASFTKVPSTPSDPGLAVVSGVEKILELSNTRTSDLDRVVHSSTVSLNAIIERKGAKLGILCTDGFGDILIIGRQKRTDMYDLFLDPETPQFLCPRERVIGIKERVGSQGEVVEPLDEASVVEAVSRLVNGHGVASIAVCYLFSYLNPAHELATRDLIARNFPDVSVSISCEVDPQMREYERMLMTAFDAYLKPVARKYLTNLADSLGRKSEDCQLQIMQSRGGIMGWRQAASHPITTALSGPAAGVIGGVGSGQSAGFSNLITVDIGGTSCDIAIITEGKPLIAAEGKLDRYPLRQQMIDVSCIGAGGGSIAWIDGGGALKVGPQSAGAFPGPACYGRGGSEPTITDASVVLGYLDPENFGCGELTLNPELSHAAITKVASRLDMDVPELALGMHRILNAMMADAIKLASVNRGFDPRKFALLGLGGGGPVHAGMLAKIIGCAHALVPPLPGVLCANGLLAADVEHEQSRTFLKDANAVDPEEMERLFDELHASCAERMRLDGLDPVKATVTRWIEARYASQSYDLQIEVPSGSVSSDTIEILKTRFHDQHERVYGHAQRAQRVRFVTARVVLSFSIANPRFGSIAVGRGKDEARKPDRQALFDLDRGYEATPVYDRQRLRAGEIIDGPAILEQPDTTTVLYPGQTARIDERGNLVISTSTSS